MSRTGTKRRPSVGPLWVDSGCSRRGDRPRPRMPSPVRVAGCASRSRSRRYITAPTIDVPTHAPARARHQQRHAAGLVTLHQAAAIDCRHAARPARWPPTVRITASSDPEFNDTESVSLLTASRLPAATDCSWTEGGRRPKKRPCRPKNCVLRRPHFPGFPLLAWGASDRRRFRQI